MKTKIMKPLIRGGFILLCLSILGSLLSSSYVLAQEPNKISGELLGGFFDYIPFEIKVGEMIQGELECEEALSVIILDSSLLKKSADFGKMVGSFFYAAETEGKCYIKITNPIAKKIGYTLTYTVLPTSLAPGAYSGLGVKSGELAEGESVSIPFEIKVVEEKEVAGKIVRKGEIVRGELAAKEALRMIILDPGLMEVVDFGKVVGSFSYVGKTEGRHLIRITNPTEATIAYTLTYTVHPTGLAHGGYEAPGIKGNELAEGHFDHISFEIELGEMIQGEVECEEALSVIILTPGLREGVDFGKIVGSFFYAAEAKGRYHIKITHPLRHWFVRGAAENILELPPKEPIHYSLTYTVLPTSLAPGTNSGPGMISRNLPAIIFGVLAVGGITYYIFILRPKKKRKSEQRQTTFIKRIKME